MTTLNADLHCHSVVSDGTLTPEALAARARSNGVELWSLTDHDEIGGQARAAAAAQALSARAHLDRHDGFGFFAAVDGLVVTGPTHTNVNDFRAVLIL